ncbi:MAG: hypothetical protein ACYDB0_00805 [Acidithiobacillus sp.]
MSIQEEKLSLMSSLTKTWGKVYDLPENHDDRWVGMQPEVEGSTAAIERISDGVQRLDHHDGDTAKASGDIQRAAVKLSGHLIVGTNIADSAMRQAGVDQHDAEVAQSWTDALQFVDAFCRESQQRIEGTKQDVHADTGGEENAYHLGMAAGSLDTASQVARQQYERGIRMSLQGPLAEYAAASAVEMGLTHAPSEGLNPTDGAVYGMYRAMHQKYAIIERLPDRQLTAIQINPADKPGLSAGELVAYTRGVHDAYIRRDPAEFADECSAKAVNLREMAAHQDDGEAYRRLQKEAVHWTILSSSVHAMDTVIERQRSQNKQDATKYRERAATYRENAGYQEGSGYRAHLDEAARLTALANLIDPPKPVAEHQEVEKRPARSREEVISGALAQMNQAFGYAKADAPGNGAAFHLDGDGTVIWDQPREQVRLASSGYSILPVIHYGPEAAPWICMEGERPTTLLVEHHGKAVVEFPANQMEQAKAYVDEAQAIADVADKLPDARAQRLTHVFHMGMLDRLDSSDVHGPEVDEARNNGLSATVLALVKDANANTFAIIEADELQTERPRPFAIPVADEDVARLTVGESASFLMLDWREHCTVLRSPEPEPKSDTPKVRETAEAGLTL